MLLLLDVAVEKMKIRKIEYQNSNLMLIFVWAVQVRYAAYILSTYLYVLSHTMSIPSLRNVCN